MLRRSMLCHRIHTVFLTALLIALGATGVGSEPEPVDGFAAKVNNRIITIGEVQTYVAPVEQQLRLSYTGSELRRELQSAREKALNNLIERALILEELKEKEAQVPESMVDDHIRSLLQERFDNKRAVMLEALAEERMSLEDWKKQIRERLGVTMARQIEVTSKIQISPTEVRTSYERLKDDLYTQEGKTQLSMIVLHQGNTEDERTAKREEAERIRQRILDGEDFSTVARAESEGSRAARGGDWGWMNPADLRKELSEAVDQLKPGEISPVLAASGEFYLLKVEGRKMAQVTPFEDVRDGIERKLRLEEEDRMYQQWVTRLKEKHYVKLF